MTQIPALWTRSYIMASLASFFMFFAFYMIMPIMAIYIVSHFNASPTVAGIVVSCYVITALLVRPFSGYLVDRYDRKKLYLISFILFSLLYLGYVFSTSILVFALFRILMGGMFSMVSTSGSTLTIDIVPSQRRGEGIGYYGAITTVAMALGPMAGLYLCEITSYTVAFICAMSSCVIGVIFASSIKAPYREPKEREPISLDRFLFVKGIPLGLILSLIALPYGSMMAYLSLYANEIGIKGSIGSFFVILAVGVIISRIFSGKYLNIGKIRPLVLTGITSLVIGYSLFAFFPSQITFFIAALMIGMGYGMGSPSFQTAIINLAPHNRRGTANSTYFIAFDLGSGLGMFLGGIIASHFDYRSIFAFGLCLVVLSIITFAIYTRKWNNQPKIQIHN